MMLCNCSPSGKGAAGWLERSVAEIAGTIPHEIMCGIATSVPRFVRAAVGGASDGRPTAVT